MTRLRERLVEPAASGRPLVADLDQVSFIGIHQPRHAHATELINRHKNDRHGLTFRPPPPQASHLTSPGQCPGLPARGVLQDHP